MSEPINPIILDQIKANLLTPPNDLKIISQMPKSTTVINDDLTLTTHTMICEWAGTKIAVVYIDIPGDEYGSQAIDAFVI